MTITTTTDTDGAPESAARPTTDVGLASATPTDTPTLESAPPTASDEIAEPMAATPAPDTGETGSSGTDDVADAAPALAAAAVVPAPSEPARPKKKPKPAAPGGDRIAKVLARAGLCSRREAEEWIAAGRVSLNGKVLDTPAMTVGPNDRISVDGRPIPVKERTRLWLFHKPRGLVTTTHDPEGRPTVFSVLPEDMPRVVSVGRLDINTEGLLLLTNDGGLARVLELPSTGWLRRYRVRAFGAVEQAALDELRLGVSVDGIDYGGIEADIDRVQGANTWLVVGLREGKNREVKRVLGDLGLDVNRLIRVSFGPFQLADLAEGEIREIRGRVLRDQLGPRLVADSGADFDAPIVHHIPGDTGEGDLPKKRIRNAETAPRGDGRGERPARQKMEYIGTGERGERPRFRSEGSRGRPDGASGGKPRSEGFRGRPDGAGGKPRSEGFRGRPDGEAPRSAGFRNRPERAGDEAPRSPRGPRSEGFRGRPEGEAPRSGGFRDRPERGDGPERPKVDRTGFGPRGPRGLAPGGRNRDAQKSGPGGDRRPDRGRSGGDGGEGRWDRGPGDRPTGPRGPKGPKKPGGGPKGGRRS